MKHRFIQLLSKHERKITFKVKQEQKNTTNTGYITLTKCADTEATKTLSELIGIKLKVRAKP